MVVAVIVDAILDVVRARAGFCVLGVDRAIGLRGLNILASLTGVDVVDGGLANTASFLHSIRAMYETVSGGMKVLQ